jgi:RNA polymerase sigma-70 factor (ECF subfamily)
MLDESATQVLNGNTEAYRKIVSALKEQAFSVAVSIVKDDQVASDIVQTAFIKAYENLETFNFQSGFETWFVRIVLNEAYVQKRKESRRATIRDQNKDVFENKDQSEEQNISSPSQKEIIQQTMRELSTDESLALSMFYLEEYSIKTISEITDWTELKAKVTLHRARKSFREKLTEKLGYKKDDLL